MKKSKRLAPNILSFKYDHEQVRVSVRIKKRLKDPPCFKYNALIISAFLDNLMRSIDKIRFHDAPDYNFFRSIFKPMTSPTMSEPSLIDEEVILSLKMEKSPARFEVSPDSPEKRKIKKISPNKPRRAGLRARPGQEPEVESQPEISPEVDYDEVRTQLEEEWNLQSLMNPTPAMLLQLERIKNRKELSPSGSSGAGTFTGVRRRVM